MSYNLFLDDERVPHQVGSYIMPYSLKKYYNEKWLIVRNYDEFVKIIQEKGIPDLISFDHDLADEHYRKSMFDTDKHYNNYYTDGTFKEKTGYECAKWLIDYCIENNIHFPEYIVHTMNPIGKENILSLIKSFINVKQRNI